MLLITTKAKMTRDDVVHGLREHGYLCYAKYTGPVPEADLCSAVLAFQYDLGLKRDEIVGKNTAKALRQEGPCRPQYTCNPWGHPNTYWLDVVWGTPRRYLHRKDRVEVFHARVYYHKSKVDIWRDVEAGKTDCYYIPRGFRGKGKVRLSMTCGHAKWLHDVYSYQQWEEGRPTWRTGRGGKLDGHRRDTPYLPEEGLALRGKVHRGLSDYVVKTASGKQGLAELLAQTGCDHAFVARHTGHKIGIDRCCPDWAWIDWRQSADRPCFAPQGIWRMSADGWGGPLGHKPYTFRRLRDGEGKGTKWKVIGMRRPDRPLLVPIHAERGIV